MVKEPAAPLDRDGRSHHDHDSRNAQRSGALHGLPRACAVNLHQLHTIEQARVGPLVTQLSGQVMKRVEASLGFAMRRLPIADFSGPCVFGRDRARR